MRISALRIGLVLLVVSSGCSRYTGQVESFAIDDSGNLRPKTLVKFNEKREVIPTSGDPIRFNSDVVTLVIQDVYLDHLPPTLTGSRDVIVFAEVWEDAATASTYEPLVGVAYARGNVLVPGRLNFDQAIAYGPTRFKGRPLKVKFTVMVLVKKSTERASTAVSMAENLVGAAAPQYSAVAGAAASLLRDLLKAQPDVVAFDFDTTLMSDKPEGLIDILNPQTKSLINATMPTTAPLSAKDTTAIKSALARFEASTPSGPLTMKSAGLRRSLPETGGSLKPEDKKLLEEVVQTHAFGSQNHWLGYGTYALVETKPQALFQSTRPDWHLFDSPRDCPALNGQVTYGRNFLWNGDTKLGLNYLTFRFDPTPLAADDAALRAASAANRKFMEELMRPEADLDAAVKSLTEHSADLRKAIWKTKLDRIAARAAKGSKNAADFETAFKKAVVAPEQGGKEWEDLVKSVLDQWKQRYESNSDNSTPTPPNPAPAPTTVPEPN